ncbi:PRC-barrel domain-containing protein [Herbiconiux sp. UC225_62]|uniref:PRC-barrel domain-containing protein n=1 Tax=Herbiconiux sp. UC225_62 TaxID=3350168 RepID=UPI0036D30988
MLPSNNIQSIVGATLYGSDKAKIGRIDQVLVDAADGHPTWAVLHGGIFGRKSLFVPLEDATWEHDDVFVELEKDDVKNAPHPDAEGGLSPAEEQELRAYYAGHRDDLAAPAAATAGAHFDARLPDDGRDDTDERQDADVRRDVDGRGHDDTARVDGKPQDARIASAAELRDAATPRDDDAPRHAAGAPLDAADERRPISDDRPGRDDPDDLHPGPDRVVI